MTQGEALMRLQEIDLALGKIQRDHGKLPQRAKIAAAKAAKKKVDSQLAHIQGQRKDVEFALADLDAEKASLQRSLDKLQAEDPDGSDYRAVTDFESRYSSLAKALEKLDYRSERTMEELITAEKAEKNARSVAARLDGELARLVDSFRSDTETMMAEARELNGERQRIADALDADTMALYRKTQKRFDGFGVEVLEGNRPSACRVTLQPSAYNDVRKQGALGECPYCHRLLIVEDGQEV